MPKTKTTTWKPYMSSCCGGGFKVAGKTTHYYKCLVCGKACDIEPADGGKKIIKTLKWEREARDIITEAMTIILESLAKNKNEPEIIIKSRNKVLEFIRTQRKEAVRDALGEVELKEKYTNALNYETSSPDGDKPSPEMIENLGYNKAVADHKTKLKAIKKKYDK